MSVEKINWQPCLEDNRVLLRPLKAEDFESLYAIASDPLVWEQHPVKERYRREVFEDVFKGAMESGGAFLVSEKKSGNAIGCTRYYDHSPEKKSVCIGYTFLGRSYWGGQYNKSMKIVMLEYAFRFVDEVIFHIGVENIRSQKATARFGVLQIGKAEMFGRPHFVYRLDRETWKETKSHL